MEQTEKISLLDFEKICRICLANKENMLPLYNDYIPSKIHGTLGVKISENEKLPNMICNLCLQNLNTAFLFKQICNLSQQLLNNILNNISTNDESFDDDFLEDPLQYVEIEQDESSPSIKKEYKNEFTEDATAAQTSKSTEPKESTRPKRKTSTASASKSTDDDFFSASESKQNDNSVKIKKEEANESETSTNKNTTSTTSTSNIITKISKEKSYVVIKIIPDFDTIKDVEKDENKIVNTIGNWIMNGKPPVKKPPQNRPKSKFSNTSLNFNNNKFFQNKFYQTKPKVDPICSTCGKKFANPRSLKRHILTHVPEEDRELFKCDVCAQVYASKESYYDHRKRHELKKKRQCNECGKMVCELQAHIKRKHQEKKFLCSECGMNFATRSFLNYHIKRKHTNFEQPKDKLCFICGKMFDSTPHLKTHILHHAGEKPFKCEQCGERFRWKEGLINHRQRVHEKKVLERKFHCDICYKRFTSKDFLKRHLIIHGDERPYSCKLCGKTYKQPSAVYTHMKTHKKQNAKQNALLNLSAPKVEEAPPN